MSAAIEPVPQQAKDTPELSFPSGFLISVDSIQHKEKGEERNHPQDVSMTSGRIQAK